MKKRFALAMAIIMSTISTAIMILAFATIPFTRNNTIFIVGVCTLGYLATLLYLDIYRKSKY